MGYTITLIDDIYWHFACKQVQTFVVTHPTKKAQIIYLWVKDSYNTAFTDIRHFFDYMGFLSLDTHEELQRYDLEDVYDYGGTNYVFDDFIVSIVEGKYEQWIETAYDGRYSLRKGDE